jgi:hypothetical protein
MRTGLIPIAFVGQIPFSANWSAENVEITGRVGRLSAAVTGFVLLLAGEDVASLFKFPIDEIEID